ncbi:MAG: glycosyltransferase family 2 protein, partial [Acidimicrobiales bacterium]
PAKPAIAAVIPARNEAATVAAVVEACLGCAYTSEVIVVDDGSTDGTAEIALGAGAKVIRLEGSGGSKAAAMEAGVNASDAEAILFCDADCIGLKAAHLDDICRPFLEGRAAMSLGWFDYGFWNPIVLRQAPSSGERIIPRWVWDSVPPSKRRGYDIEIMINEVIAEGRLPTTVRIMSGVTHRTKRDKFGRRKGLRETWRMFWHLVGLPVRGVVRFRTYWFYWRELTIER